MIPCGSDHYYYKIDGIEIEDGYFIDINKYD